MDFDEVVKRRNMITEYDSDMQWFQLAYYKVD
jgi:hypothetical protein